VTKLVLHVCDAKGEAENARVTNKSDIPKRGSETTRTLPEKESLKPADRDRIAKSLYPWHDNSPPEPFGDSFDDSFDDSSSSTVHQETECPTAPETQLRKCHSIFAMFLNPTRAVS
jgi:hypothetical protein